MPNFNSNLITALDAVRTDPSLIGAIGVSNMNIFVEGTFSITAGFAANDTVQLVPASLVPVGCAVDPDSSFFYCESTPGTSVIVDVGTSANDDVYADAVTLATGPGNGPIPFSKGATLVAAQSKITEQAAIFATVKTASGPAACVVRFRVTFKARV